MAAALLWWVFPMTRGTGGRDPHVLSIGLGLMAVAFVATKAWTVTSMRVLALAASLPIAAVVVCAFAPTGWRGLNDVGSWSLAVLVYVTVRAYGRSRDRVHALLLMLALGGVGEFAAAWLAWWGGENPAKPMIGTFYWHNQYAAFLLVPALVGVALAVWPRKPGVAVGWVAAPLCSAGVLFSTSRATLGLLIVGWVCAFVVAALSVERRRAVPRAVAAAVLTVATMFVLTGPPFFPHRSAPSAAVAARSQSQSAGGNADYRTQTWREAGVVFERYPVTGTGFHGFASAASSAMPRAPHSAFAHDAWLQALSDGGVVLGVPFLVASALLSAGLVTGARRRLRARLEPQLVMTAVAALLLAAHSLVDFDTSYPALFAMLALAAAIPATGGAVRSPVGASVGRVRTGRLQLAVCAALIATAGIGAWGAWHGGWQLNLRVAHGATVMGDSG